MAVYTLNWLITAQPDHTLAIKILLLSKEGDLPYQFQVRVGGNRTYRKGELLLLPWVVPTNMVTKHCVENEGTLATHTTAKVVHESLCTSATLTVCGIGVAGSQPTPAGSQPTPKKSAQASADPKPTLEQEE